MAQKGLAGVNTNAIAREAGCSVGSVYVHFGDKQAVLQALLERFGQRLLAAVVLPLSQHAAAPLGQLVRKTLEAFVAFYVSEPGYRELWLGAQLTDDTVNAGQAWGAAFGGAVAGVLRARTPRLSPERATRVADVVITAASALVTRSLVAQDEDVVEEAALMLTAYLEGVGATVM